MIDEKYAPVLDQFIDDLLAEKKPAIYDTETVEPELEQLFETVRAVKRIRTERKAVFYKSRWFKGLATVAAALLLVAGLGILNTPGVYENNIVHAVVRAYDELRSYSGVAEIRSEQQDGEVDFLETIEIRYEKPFRYAATHRYNGFEVQYLSDGGKLAVIEPEVVTVDYLFPEKELWRYHIGTTVWELEEAAEVNILGEETLFGRQVTVLEYRFRGDDVYHQLWIDDSTRLPLRKILNHPEGSRLVVEFKELAINPSVEENTFAWVLPQDKKVVELNRAGTLEEAAVIWPQAEKAREAAGNLPGELQLLKAGLLNNDLFELVLRFQGTKENDFLDIYYSSTPLEKGAHPPGGLRGILGDGHAGLKSGVRNVFKRYIGDSNVAWWSAEEGEVYIVSSRETSQLQMVLEDLAGEKVQADHPAAEEATLYLTLYFMEVTETEFKLAAEKREYSRPPGAGELLRELLDGPRGDTLQRIIPADTRLLDLRLEGKIAYADFSAEIAAGNYGSETEGVLVNSIVRTLTQLEEVDAVQILVEGQIVESLGGHIFIGKPLQ